MVLLFAMTLVVSITQMPLLMIILRSVSEEERSFALGMQFVIFRLFGYIPAPIMFGNVIDSSCILRKAHCGKPGGFCLVYNIEQFRLKYIAVCSGAGLLHVCARFSTVTGPSSAATYTFHCSSRDLRTTCVTEIAYLWL
uniref:Putative solute carrier organic anion transporter family member 5a1-like isoform x1 n=1 Tax=Ixodes ricinus TaxID=34613 RepID=A0A131XRY7_IXORI